MWYLEGRGRGAGCGEYKIVVCVWVVVPIGGSPVTWVTIIVIGVWATMPNNRSFIDHHTRDHFIVIRIVAILVWDYKRDSHGCVKWNRIS